jgi:phosphohistidine phosphatase
MELYFLRHGLAAEPDSARFASDAERPLTLEGRRKMKRIAKAIRNLELSLDLVLSSPYVRARQTAEMVVEVLGAGRRLRFSEQLEPGSDVGEVIVFLKKLSRRYESVMLVGHEPLLSQTISLLVAGGPASVVEMKKGGLCKICVESSGQSLPATIQWLLTPKQLQQLG